MIVILAEKPDMAKKIGEALGIKERKQSYYILHNGSYLTWAIGHIAELKSPSLYDEYKKWSIDALPVIPKQMQLVVSKGKEEQFKTIESLLNKCTELHIATDPDREGELIARYIMELAGYKGLYKRVWINDLTVDTITKAFKEIKEGKQYDSLAAAARLRSYADYWIGMTATRYFTLLAQANGHNTTLNAGRVLTPTLKLVYDREMEMTNHKTSYRYHIEAVYKNGFKSKYQYMLESKVMYDLTKDEADALTKKIDSIRSAIVKDVTSKSVKVSPPPLFHTDSIKSAARKAFKYGIKQTEQLVQSLYDKGFISYPRTSSSHITMNVAHDLVSYIHNFKSLYPQYFQSEQLRDIKQDSRYVDDDKASVHYAIIPTKQLAKDLSKDEQQLYDLIVKQTLLAFQPIGIDEVTEVIVNHHEHQFVMKSKVTIQDGFRTLFKEEEEAAAHDDPQNKDLKTLQKGQILDVEAYQLKTIESKPPKRYAEDELVKAMGNIGSKLKLENLKEKGIGTPATRAATVEKLKQEEFIKTNKNLVYITQKGLSFMEMVKEHELANVELTSEFEELLSEVEEGKKSFDVVKQHFVVFTHDLLKTKFNAAKDFSSQESIADCLCGKGKIVAYKEHYGCTNYKNGCKISISKVFRGVKLTEKVVKSLVAGNETLITGLVNGQGKSYSLVMKFKDNKLETRFPTDDDLKIGDCFICKKAVIETDKTYSCKTSNCLKIYKTFLGKKLTLTIVKTLIKGKTTELIHGMEAKDGRAIIAKLLYSADEKRVIFAKDKK